VTSPTEILLLEVDAGDKHLLVEWARSGVLPNFAALLERGLVGHTMAPRGFFVGSIWPSFYTGVSPARHGIHSLAMLRPGTYEVTHLPTGEHVKREPFWNHLSRAGKRVAVLDIPLSGISEAINGIQTVEWGSHDENYGFRAWPPSLRSEIEAKFGLHPLEGPCNRDHRTPAEFRELRDTLIRGVQTKAELTRHYLRQGGWQFFAQVFTESHCVGHQCWHLHAPDHPGHEPDVARLIGDPIKDVYVAIDAAIGRILAEVGADTKVIVLAGHGMAHKHGAQFLLHEILIRLKVAEPRTTSAEAAPPPPRLRDRLDEVLAWGWRRLPDAVKGSLRSARGRVRGWIDGPDGIPAPKLDHARSRCFIVDNGFSVGGIRLNLVGREPAGLVRRGEEMDALCALLERELLDIRDLETGKPVVAAVVRTRGLYQGEHLDLLPDVLVEWNPELPLGTATAGKPGSGRMRIGSDAIGVIEGENRYCRTGEHRPEGLFVAVGGGIKPGKVERTVSIMDFAPTFTRMLGVELSDVDGDPVEELL
jgi:predicted AlkP superfamily phosphohydrolase/phosphomutase